MIITEEEQIRIIVEWNTKEKSTRDLLCFLDGMRALSKLIEDKVKAEKEQIKHYEKLHKHYDKIHQVESSK